MDGTRQIIGRREEADTGYRQEDQAKKNELQPHKMTGSVYLGCCDGVFISFRRWETRRSERRTKGMTRECFFESFFW